MEDGNNRSQKKLLKNEKNKNQRTEEEKISFRELRNKINRDSKKTKELYIQKPYSDDKGSAETALEPEDQIDENAIIIS